MTASAQDAMLVGNKTCLSPKPLHPHAHSELTINSGQAVLGMPARCTSKAATGPHRPLVRSHLSKKGKADLCKGAAGVWVSHNRASTVHGLQPAWLRPQPEPCSAALRSRVARYSVWLSQSLAAFMLRGESLFGSPASRQHDEPEKSQLGNTGLRPGSLVQVEPT